MKFDVGGAFYENSTKLSVSSLEEPSVFHIVGSDICGAAVHRTRGCFHGNACNVYCIVDSDTNVNNVKGTVCCVYLETVVTRTRHNVTLIVGNKWWWSCLGSDPVK